MEQAVDVGPEISDTGYFAGPRASLVHKLNITGFGPEESVLEKLAVSFGVEGRVGLPGAEHLLLSHLSRFSPCKAMAIHAATGWEGQRIRPLSFPAACTGSHKIHQE
jgi:hypothetical protein